MNHTRIEEQLSLLLDGKLSEAEAGEVRQHIETCARCRKTLAAFTMVREGMKDIPAYELPPMFASNVVRAIRQRMEQLPQWMGVDRVARRLVFALGLLSMAVIGVSALNTQEVQPGTERYFTGEPVDSSVVRTLMQKEDISKDDVLIAAVVD